MAGDDSDTNDVDMDIDTTLNMNSEAGGVLPTHEADDDDDRGRLELVPEPQRVQSVAINYARVAKRVDVIALKKSINELVTEKSKILDNSRKNRQDRKRNKARAFSF